MGFVFIRYFIRAILSKRVFKSWGKGGFGNKIKGGWTYRRLFIERGFQTFYTLRNSHMKANYGKSHVLLSSDTQLIVSFDNVPITSSLREKLLGIAFNSELNF